MTLPSEDRPEREFAPRPPDYTPTPERAAPAPDPTAPAPDPTRPGAGLHDDGPGFALGSEPSPTAAGDRGRPLPDLPGDKSGHRGPARVPHTRIGAAWAGVWAGVLVVILLIVFIGQNTAGVKINFLWMSGNIPTALALLIAGVGGAIIAMAVAAARIIQLRRLVRRR